MISSARKKRIVIYGVDDIEMRQSIKFFLDDSYTIIGYSDHRYVFDVLGGRSSVFFSPDELKTKEIDFVLLALNDNGVINAAIAKLRHYGIAENRIILPIIRGGGTIRYQENLVKKIENASNDYEGLIMGWSYSLRGIHRDELKQKFFDFSWHGLDLYYNWKLYLHGKDLGKFRSIKRLLLVMPYAYLNHEQSQSIFQFQSGQLFAVHELDDWHNVEKMSKEHFAQAMQCIVNWRMFGKRLSKYYDYHFHYFPFDNPQYEGEFNKEHLDPMWWKDRPETIEENHEILRKITEHFTSMGIEISVIVAPYLIAAFDEESRSRIPVVRQEFYDLIKKESDRVGKEIKIYDFFAAFPDERTFFSDSTHLNNKGAAEWTKMINEFVLQI